jgi:[protein-PII] uridylyltransferase
MTPESRMAVGRAAEERQRLIDSLFRQPRGLAWCAKHTDIADQVVRIICDDLASDFGEELKIAVIATGGYGRQELSPHSDIDITVVPGDEASPVLDRAIRQLFQDLHWAFGTALRISVGYAYRLIGDAPGLDAKTRTGLMDMRLLWGSHDLYQELEGALHDSFAAGEFILSKINERQSMFAKYHDTPLVAEPQLKEGAGGLRCFHCANWIRESIGEHSARPSYEYDRIVRYRNLLHTVVGKHQDSLTRGRQAEIADRLGTDVYAMMSEIALCGMALNGEYQRATERLCESRYQLAPSVLAVAGEARVIGRADAGEAAVGIAVATQLGLRVSDIPVVTSESVQGPAAVYAVSTGEATLRNLDRCGLLASMLPELDACRTLMPRDTVHAFTVFEHSMRVVRFLDEVPTVSFLGEIRAGLRDLDSLYLAALLHDVGKLGDDATHSETGADVVRNVCERWGVNATTAADAEWLVLNHLEMNRFIRLRDTQDPSTIVEFANLVGDPERLGLLALLTWADVNAVSPGAWTQAQETFLRDLYLRTMEALQGEALQTPDVAQTRQRLFRQLKGSESESEVQQFVESLPAHYMTSTPVEVVRLHMKLVRKAVLGEPTVELFHRSDIGATDITICALDKPGLLSKLLGVFYGYDLSVMGIRASTTSTDPPVALDVFTLGFNGRPVPTGTYNQVARHIVAVLSGEKDVASVLREKGKDPDRKQQFFGYQYHEGSPGLLEVRAPRGRGMPYRFSRLLAEAGWNIIGARVGQWAGNGAATFSLTGRDGTHLSREEVDKVLQRLPYK